MFDKKSIKVYNSLTNKIEDFKTIKENEVSMYVCGPTVYNHMHIGNGRPVVFTYFAFSFVFFFCFFDNFIIDICEVHYHFNIEANIF